MPTLYILDKVDVTLLSDYNLTSSDGAPVQPPFVAVLIRSTFQGYLNT